jgi:hypothetical protein
MVFPSWKALIKKISITFYDEAHACTIYIALCEHCDLYHNYIWPLDEQGAHDTFDPMITWQKIYIAKVSNIGQKTCVDASTQPWKLGTLVKTKFTSKMVMF